MLFLVLLLLTPTTIFGNASKNLIILTTQTFPLVILSPPLPVNASLGLNAEFNCMCHYCIGQYWLVNDIFANYQENYDKGIRRYGPTVLTNGSKLYTVEMPASVQLNDSTIECVAYNGTVTTASVKLLVQGMLLLPTQ